MAVDEQHAGRLGVRCPVAGHGGDPPGGALGVIGKLADLFPAGSSLRGYHPAQVLAPFAGWFVAQLFEAGHPREGQRGEQNEDGLDRIEALGQGEMVADVAQQADGEQRRQGAEDAAVGDVIGGGSNRSSAASSRPRAAARRSISRVVPTPKTAPPSALLRSLWELGAAGAEGLRGSGPPRPGHGLPPHFLVVRVKWLCGRCWAARQVLCRWRAHGGPRQGELAPWR